MSKADHGGTWRPEGNARRNERLRWPYIPLIALAVFSVGPSVLAPIFFMLSSFFDVSAVIGPVQQPPGLLSILLYPFFLGMVLWPFLALYHFTREAFIKERPCLESVRLAMIVSVIAMSLPSSIFLVATPAEMMSSAPDAGQGIGIAGFLFMVLLPFPGILGWFIGRGIAWILWSRRRAGP